MVGLNYFLKQFQVITKLDDLTRIYYNTFLATCMILQYGWSEFLKTGSSFHKLYDLKRIYYNAF